MTAQRRLISLVGTLVVIVTLVAGTLLMALPVYIESRDIKNEETRVAAANQVLVAQIEGLRAKEAEMPQVNAELAGLRTELPHTPQLDDAVKLALRAASTAGGTVTEASFGDVTGFVPRTIDTVLESLPKTATDVKSAQSDPAPTNGDGSEGDSATSGSDAGTTGNGPDTAAGAAQLQVPVTITVTVPNPTAAARFLDALREGPRLLQIETVAGVLDPESDEVTLTVNGLVFVQAK